MIMHFSGVDMMGKSKAEFFCLFVSMMVTKNYTK